jgi:hypothetical protein
MFQLEDGVMTMRDLQTTELASVYGGKSSNNRGSQKHTAKRGSQKHTAKRGSEKRTARRGSHKHS